MKKKLYSWVTFNKEGNLKGFSSGFSKLEYKKLILKDLETGHIVCFVNSLSELPPKFLEGFYYKTSKNNDLLEFLTIKP